MSVLPFAAGSAVETTDLPPEPEVTDDLPPEPGAEPAPLAGEAVVYLDPQARGEQAAVVLRPVVFNALATANAFVCATPDDYAHAAQILDALRTMEERIDTKLGPIIDDAHKTHRALTGLRAEMKDPIVTAAKAVKQRCALWREAEDRKAREEAARLAREQQAIERAAAEQQAKQLEADGQAASAALVREDAQHAPAPAIHVPSAVPKVAGMVERYEYGYRIVNKALIPDEFWIVDEKAIAALVRSQKDAFAVPGVEVTKTPATSFRKSR